MEMLDILNPDGTKAGYTASKKETHEKGLWHRTAHVWLVNSKKEVLLQLRARDLRSYPGCWDISAAGHLTAGDSKIQGALREVKEEIGVDLKEDDLIYLGELVDQSTQHEGKHINNEYQDVYVVRRDMLISDFKIQESEVEELRYVPLPELKSWVANHKPDLVEQDEEYALLFKYLDK